MVGPLTRDHKCNIMKLVKVYKINIVLIENTGGTTALYPTKEE